MCRAKCTHCDFSVDYSIDNGADYHYHGLSMHSQFPIIEYAWCNDCKKFVHVQLGIHSQIGLGKKLYQELISLEKKFLKTSSVRNKIERTKALLFDSVILNAMTDGKETINSCVLCGSNNVVFKNLKEEIWQCPKCKIGSLKLKEEKNDDDGLLLRRGEIFITPTSKKYATKYYLVSKVLSCGIDIINNESVFYRHLDNVNMLATLKSRYKTSLIDRISLIYSVLTIMFKYPIRKEVFVLDMLSELMDMEFVTDDIKNHVVARFDERIEYFKSEIEIEMKCSSFLPSAMIKTLENPANPPTRDITGMDVLEVLKHWDIISKTISAYFKHGI